jgi:putative cell wall-binding protein
MRPIRYRLDNSAIDAAFVIQFSVNGKPVTDACYGEQVVVSITEPGAVGLLSLVGWEEGGERSAFVCDAQGTSFTMPGSSLTLSARYSYELNLSLQSVTGRLLVSDTLDYADLEAASVTGEILYSGWNTFGEREMATVSRGLPLASLLSSRGIDFSPGDTLIIQSASGDTDMLSYETLFGQWRYCYPNIAFNDASDPLAVEPLLALISAARVVTNYDSNPVPDKPQSMVEALRLIYGQTEWDLVERTPSVRSQLTQIVSLRVLKGAIPMSTITVSGVESSYLWTGGEVRPQPTLRNAEGDLLIENRDFELAYEDNTDAGTGRVIATGLGAYTGTLDATFRILRAQPFSGTDRYHTAAQLITDTYSNGSNGVIIASGANFPDALAATALAGILDYPIVLSAPEELPEYSLQTLEHLSFNKRDFQVLIVGGEPSVGAGVEAQLAERFGRGAVSRIAGSDRYATALEVLYFGSLAGGWSDTVIVATGANFADALAISPYAAWSNSPIVLCDGSALAEQALSEISALGFRHAVIVGGTPSVDEVVAEQLAKIVGAGNVMRLAGSNRYATSKEIAVWELSQGMNCVSIAIATGENFPDALTGGALLGREGSILLLASETNTSALSVFSERRDEPCRLCFFGSEASVSLAVRFAALDILGWDRGLIR